MKILSVLNNRFLLHTESFLWIDILSATAEKRLSTVIFLATVTNDYSQITRDILPTKSENDYRLITASNSDK
jgi:hypothetical protein